MPLYKYKCPECGNSVEHRASINEVDEVVLVCFRCKGHRRKVFLERVPQAPALVGFDNLGRSK